MKVLSIRQPWAWLIIHGGKDIENRSWPTKFRGRFYVHASKKIEHHVIRSLKINPSSPIYYSSIKLPTEYEAGGIIGSVELVDCLSGSPSSSYGGVHPSPWFEGPYGFVLQDPKPMKFQPLLGKLGFFEV